MSSIYLASHIQFGVGARLNIGGNFCSLNCKKVMVVTDEGIVKAGILDDIIKSLSDSGITYALFDKVIPDPDVTCVHKARDFYLVENCDGMLAVGGGSSIDTAKGAGLLITNSDPLMSLAGLDKVKNPLPPLVAIPTTCGTGSEVTNVTVITDEQHAKIPFVSSLLTPKVAILDPELLYKLPSHIVAATGIDALTHAVEALTNKNENWYADACAIQAVRMISKNIRPAVLNQDEKALGEMLYASSLAGISFTVARLGLVHAMSHPVSGFAGVPHGLANAILLPYILDFNLVGNPEAHALFAKELGVSDQGSAIQTAKAGVQEVIKMNQELGIPKSFSEIGVNDECMSNMIEDTFKSPNIAINAREVTRKDVEEIYAASFSGKLPLAVTSI
ncbi:iron-containing alcohol dehydrogenase family protein [Halalkalibacterium ligniniphilum]|uniref:iron-containing alcohol dehydrogenase family protein n=1 Tax=Halalkalibacterium ligniniphilum TaxID=1134413 RepID=UPI000348F349|nr:iron-containing alcohol dehydrogenase [Halalkalibacterium ligniniphilum]